MLENIKSNNHINDPSIKRFLSKIFWHNATNFNLIEKCSKNAYVSPEV